VRKILKEIMAKTCDGKAIIPIGTEFTFTDPDTLQPGQRSPFDIAIFRGSIPMQLISSYTLAPDYSSYSIFE
jgi:hypothetical protein